jgi:hypothetical protein
MHPSSIPTARIVGLRDENAIVVTADDVLIRFSGKEGFRKDQNITNPP